MKDNEKKIKVQSFTEIPDSEKLRKEWIQLEIAAKKYGYETKLKEDCFYIWTKTESWYYYYNQKGRMVLMHGNTPGRIPNGWHNQAIHKLYTPEGLIEYVHDHEEYVYKEGRKIEIQKEIKKIKRNRRK